MMWRTSVSEQPSSAATVGLLNSGVDVSVKDGLGRQREAFANLLRIIFDYFFLCRHLFHLQLGVGFNLSGFYGCQADEWTGP